MVTLSTGDVIWADLGTRAGREQAGRRPVIIVASMEYLEVIDALAVVVPVTSRDRGWPNHVPITGVVSLDKPSFAMTEQPTTVARNRMLAAAGFVDEACMAQVRMYLRDFLDFR
jgi:mRNA interferase MazF